MKLLERFLFWRLDLMKAAVRFLCDRPALLLLLGLGAVLGLAVRFRE